MKVLADYKYPIGLMTKCTEYPVFIINRTPLLDRSDVEEYIEEDLEDECVYRKGTIIAMPYQGTTNIPRTLDIDTLNKAWESAHKAIHSASSRTIKCKGCESSFVRERVSVQCPMCFGILGSNTNANRINKCRIKLKEKCSPAMGTNHLIVQL